MTRILSQEELSSETGVSSERIHWMASIAILRPVEPGRFRAGDVFRVKLIGALLDAGFTREQIEWGAAEGGFNLDHVDDFLLVDPGPRSERTFSQFLATVGARSFLLPAVYEVLGLPQPDPSSPIHVHEEELLERFLEGWNPARSDETLIRAARLIGEGTRMASMGWANLSEEQVAGPARERLLRGEVERFPEEALRSITTLIRLAPRMMAWLVERYLEQRAVAGIVEGFEQFLAARGLAPPPQPTAPPAVVFVDLSGYTDVTEQHGDEVAVRFAAVLQQRAEAVAASRGGRLVKLLGDGAMLCFPEPRRGLDAALALVEALSADTALPAHAGVHAGPVIERDLDLFGRTVNLASRIAEAAEPGEVLVSEAMVRAVKNDGLRFERAGERELKGVAQPFPLFRVIVERG